MHPHINNEILTSADYDIIDYKECNKLECKHHIEHQLPPEKEEWCIGIRYLLIDPATSRKGFMCAIHYEAALNRIASNKTKIKPTISFFSSKTSRD